VPLLLEATTLGGLGLAAYHHAAYPLLLRWLAGRQPEERRPEACGDLPHVTLVMPAYDEAEHIAAKIRNLAALDYPADRLLVLVGCDGCRDDTAARACAAGREPECAHLRLEVVEFPENRGKVAVLNDLVGRVAQGIVALSDVSALISLDALRLAADWFRDPGTGVVCAGYRFLRPGTPGEATYWRYQTAIKRQESRLGSTLGAHGALYLFRRELFRPLPGDTINDDFVLPMSMVALGRRAVYEPEMVALELERASLATDRSRRRRIAAGNAQQAVRLRALLDPRQGWPAFMFASGKVLRVAMPLCLLVALLGSLLLAPGSPLFALAAAAQLLAWLAAAAAAVLPERRRPVLLARILYVLGGHVASAHGTLRWLTGRDRGRWRRVATPSEIPS
jgi:cellulose synthase/poly-beta-1,6-N-acetylglucosamine synthase-like glycosyltransferase